MNTLFDEDPSAPATKGKRKPATKPAKKVGTAVAVHTPKQPASKPAKITSAMSMLSFIGEAAMNPNVDPAKMRELLAIRKDLKDEESRGKFDADYLKLQREVANIKIGKRGVIAIYHKNDPEHLRPPMQSTPYAKYEDLARILRPMLHRHGFVLKHRNAVASDGKPTVVTKLVHSSGAFDESEFVGEIDASGSKNNVQGRGSTISYGKRYNTVSLLDIITEEDDDGQKGKSLPITEAQLTEIVELCEAHGVDKRRFCEHFRVSSLADIPASRFENAKTQIQKKRRK